MGAHAEGTGVMRPMTPAQKEALADLERGPLHRTPDGSGWLSVQSRFVPLVVGAKLRQRGFARHGVNCRELLITEAGAREAAGG
jgi:hypothetical protein